MEQEIKQVYEIFKKILLKKSDMCFSKEFVQLIKDGELKCDIVNDENLLKLAVLSSHKEWEGIYQSRHIDLNGSLGDVCKDLTTRGLDHFQIAAHELEMMRNEIVDGDNKYSTFIKAISENKQKYEESPCNQYCRYLFQGYLELKRVAETRECIYKLIHEHRDNTSDLDVPVLVTMMYERLYSEDDFTPDEEELRYAVENFAKYESTNRIIGLYDPIIYTIYFVKAIEYYFDLLYENDWQVREVVKLPSYNIDENAFKILKVQPRFYMSRFTEYFSDNTLHYDADKDIFKLMKLHDELIVSIVPYVGDPALSLILLTPIFNGTKILIRRRLLNMTYPNKLEDVLYSTYDMPATALTPINLKVEQIRNILLAEFNTAEDLKEVNDFFEPENDNDDSEDDDQEPDEGIEEEDDDQEDSDICINLKKLVDSMNSPGWEKVEFSTLFTKMYQSFYSDWKPGSNTTSIAMNIEDIIKGVDYSSEQKTAALKALSLIEYEYAEVILVKVICYEGAELKSAALEALLNLKRPIDSDAYSKLCDCMDGLDDPIKDNIKNAIDKELITAEG